MLALQPTDRIRFTAEDGADYLYDCHSARFRRLDGRSCPVTGFLPLFVARLFGIGVRAWHETLRGAAAELRARDEGSREEWLAQHAPVTSLESAAEVALLAYPAMESIVHRVAGPRAPFALEERYLLQDNVPLGSFEVKRDGRWTARRDATVSDLRAALTRLSRERRPPPPPGVYVIGHSSVLVRGERGGIVIDPVALGPLATDRAVPISALRSAASAVALTHGHFDHYHLPTLLALSELPVLVKSVPRSTVVCEDIARRLEESDASNVVTTEWGDRHAIDDVVVHVLPFVGEQFLVDEVHPDVRNWGQTLVIEAAGFRTMVLADSGFEAERDVFDVVRAWVSDHGSIDVLVCQSIALRPSFADGDPDLQLTGLIVPHRAVDALRLQAPEARVTMAVEDLPVLCRLSGAKVFVPHGQFGLDVGSPAIGRALLSRIREVLAAECPDVRVEPVSVGAGLDAGNLRPVRWLA